MNSAEQLSRTTLLYQADFGIEDPSVVRRALMSATVLLVAGDDIMKSYPAQVALTTTAILLARSGLAVFIEAPDAFFLGYQPPMLGSTLYEAILSVSDSMIDGAPISIGRPLLGAEIAFIFGGGSAGLGVSARRLVSVGWTKWSGQLAPWPNVLQRSDSDWPIGAMAAAVLTATEALKIVGQSLARLSQYQAHLLERFANSDCASLVLAPEGTPCAANVGHLDVVSAGAISNAVLYALLRLPKVQGRARVFDKDKSDPSNRNRNMLLIPLFENWFKVDLLRHFGRSLVISPVRRHFAEEDLRSTADRIVVGVDDIPTRWMLARARCAWMGVGATSHFDSMASVHYPAGACAACLHPRDEHLPGHTPTIAVVSFLAGLMVAVDLLLDVAKFKRSTASSYKYITPFQLDGGAWSSAVSPNPNCPRGCQASLRAA